MISHEQRVYRLYAVIPIVFFFAKTFSKWMRYKVIMASTKLSNNEKWSSIEKFKLSPVYVTNRYQKFVSFKKTKKTWTELPDDCVATRSTKTSGNNPQSKQPIQQQRKTIIQLQHQCIFLLWHSLLALICLF